MNNINSKQNKTTATDMIAALRQKYTDVKWISNWQFYIAVVVPVALTLVAIVLKSEIITSSIGKELYDVSAVVAIVCLIITVFDFLVFTKSIDDGKELAAKIQERFDTLIFDMPWNEVIAGTKPSSEEINQLRRKYLLLNNSDTSALVDWYNPQVSSVEHEKGILLCQRMNLYWDVALRKVAIKQVKVISITWLATVIVIGLFQNMTLLAFIVSTLIPLLPVCLYALKLISDNTKSIETLTRLKELLEKAWNDVLQRSIDQRMLREIQNEIFTHRKTNRPVSDKFYWKRKDTYEEDAQYTIEKMIEDIS